MPLEQLFSLANLAVLPGWLLLAVAPRWRWSQRYALLLIPTLLGPLYAGLLLSNWGKGGGFGSLAEVTLLFQTPANLLAGWIHYLVFDLFLGAWETRDAAARGIPHLALIPCLAGTFLFGPLGLLLYLLIRVGWKRAIDP